MTINELIQRYTLQRDEVIAKAIEVREADDKSIYDKVNELDELTEELYILDKKAYIIPEANLDLVVVDNNGKLTVSQMKQNIQDIDKFLDDTIAKIKTWASVANTQYVAELDDLKHTLETAEKYIQRQEGFTNINIEDKGYVYLDPPNGITFDKETKVLKWNPVQHATVYSVAYAPKVANQKPSYTVIDDLEISVGKNEVSANLDSTLSILGSGTYIIKISANNLSSLTYIFADAVVEITN